METLTYTWLFHPSTSESTTYGVVSQTFNLRTHDIRILLPGSSLELEPHPQASQTRSLQKKFGRHPSHHPLYPRYSWSEKDIEVASIAAINFSRAFYESYDKPADRLPVRYQLRLVYNIFG